MHTINLHLCRKITIRARCQLTMEIQDIRSGSAKLRKCGPATACMSWCQYAWHHVITLGMLYTTRFRHGRIGVNVFDIPAHYVESSKTITLTLYEFSTKLFDTLTNFCSWNSATIGKWEYSAPHSRGFINITTSGCQCRKGLSLGYSKSWKVWWNTTT